MNFNWKHGAGALALSVAMLSMSATAQVAPAGRPVKAPAEVVQPAPSVDVETGQMLDKGPRWPKIVEKTSDTPPPVDDAAAPNTERGIRDNAIKSCGSCGVTGKAAAPPPVDDGAAPPSADWEDPKGGQHFDKGKPKPPSATERRAHNGPGGTPPSTAKHELCGVPYTPKCVTNATAKKGSNTGLILGITAGAAALAAVLASGNNDDRPTSP